MGVQAVPGVLGRLCELVGGHARVHAFVGSLPGVLAVFCLVSGLSKARVIRAARFGICSFRILLCIRQCLPYNV